MKTLLLLLFACRMSSSVKHSLTYMASGFSGVPNMPDYMMTGEFGQIQVDYCDSNKTRRSYPGLWEKLNQIDPEILKFLNEQCFEIQPLFFKGVISGLKENNTNEAVHILQGITGCGWDERTGDRSPILRRGYDGENFMELDMKTFTWIVQNPLAAPIKQMWDANPAVKAYLKRFFTEICPQWLKKLVSLGLLKETDWRRYDCVFQLSGLENNITTILDKNMIRTNLVSPSEFPSGAVIGGCVGLLLLLLCITGLFFWKRNNNGFRPTNTSDSSEKTSDSSQRRNDDELQ
ncbi:major histocompatibility complex class I-related gene protein-like isoform X3 [Melanotaenia boesemani]|uniref:major histocompatibility complex class I-related gene protein-like isoform X3 n=1 Tax=Melanotaenia boesemani TaxID=1250792 RepID=UPI001C04977E|nr:major histocompatibility complex class I-related gene protein-like isoform X3 [Melanotaenia boesemani]